MARVPGYSGGLVFFSLCYVVVRWVLQFAAVRVQANDLKELELVVLRHELAILRRRTRRPGIHVDSLDYVRLRPDVTVITPAGTLPNTWDLSNVHANLGVGFYPFRK